MCIPVEEANHIDKEKLINFLRKEFINFENDLINLPVIKINLLMDKIENGVFD
ncbi:hypothetical protein [Spiroplasma ixodetis]|uniref:Uncharacterized protein n=1 Tax=Spiroplasma ixodetis TaxID=2141 RepID=A0ABM8BYX9_9MOLU|nr:hypothetical protein [Spiroplasma ixodetis]BDT05080.1 hypothetical protein SHM_27260 [Spiroplasma ixodetis]